MARNEPGQLAEPVTLIDKGVVAVEAETRPLTALLGVHRAAERGLVRGKVTLSVEG
ncbi:hypothetical protein [Nonomuraea sp. NPDC050310]|uniref:hypothetical protein n=1 Tax=Nonomuraea sp. NPDC050310 TaxID=3154935 RepID=UPI00340DBC8D